MKDRSEVKDMKQDDQWRELATLLGFARKAGRLSFGISACSQSCLRKKAKLIILAKDLSDNTRKRIDPIIHQNRIKSVLYGTKAQFGILFNRKDTGMICIEDVGFADGIERLIS